MDIKAFFHKYRKKLVTFLSSLKLPPFAVVIGFLGAYAGSHGTSLLWRRAGIAGILTVVNYIVSGMNADIGWVVAIWHISLMTEWGAYSMGYGIPDDNYPDNPGSDSGSDIGRFWTLLFRKYYGILKAHRIADYFTRGTVAFCKSLFFISVPILRGNWICYGVGALGIILSNVLFSWRGWGSFKMKVFNKEVEFLWSDIVNYTIEGLCFYIMSFWKFL
jgi:hypothetical protein